MLKWAYESSECVPLPKPDRENWAGKTGGYVPTHPKYFVLQPSVCIWMPFNLSALWMHVYELSVAYLIRIFE